MCPKGHAAAMSRIFSADATSLLKVLLHSAKHPSRSINGLLLGKVDGEGVSIIDAVPLFHTPTCLASPLETALRMVDAELAENGNVFVVGYYEAGSQYSRPELSNAGRSIADKLAQLYKTMSLCLLVDSIGLANMIREEDILPFQTMIHKTGNWQSLKAGEGSLVCASGSLRGIFLDFMKDGQHRKIVDFDEHLDDASRDYMNEGIRA